MANAGVEHLDPDRAAEFDSLQGTPDFADDLAVLTGNGKDPIGTLVDLGAGTGLFAIAAAPYARRVVAVDAAPAMVSIIESRASAARLTNVECANAGFLSYQHTGPPADVVTIRNALNQIPDFWKAIALDRIARSIRPGGILRLRDTIFNFKPADADKEIDRWLTCAENDDGEFTGEDYATHLREEFSTFRWLLEPMLDAARFDIVTCEFWDVFNGTYTCVRR